MTFGARKLTQESQQIYCSQDLILLNREHGQIPTGCGPQRQPHHGREVASEILSGPAGGYC